MTDSEQSSFLNDLQAPLKSFRLFAIEHFIHEGSNTPLLTALENALASESDEECRLMLGHAIASVRGRGSSSQGSDERSFNGATPAEFPSRFESADPEKRLKLLKGLKKSDLSELASWATNVFPLEKHPLVARELIRRFQPVWPEDRLVLLQRALSGKLQTVRFAAIEALMVIAPRSLIDHLPMLLQADDPRLRSMTIRALAIIDSAEAHNHLEALLLNPNRLSRIAALRECSRLPFSLTRPLLLSFMAIERDPALLDAAGAILAANPDPEIPFRLADIMTQRTDLAQILGTILHTIIAMLHASGQLPEDQAIYQKRLQEHVNRLCGRRIVRKFLLTFSLSDASIQDEALDTLRSYLNRPAVLQAIREAMADSLPESVRIVLQNILQPLEVKATPLQGSPSPFPAPAPAPAPGQASGPSPTVAPESVSTSAPATTTAEGSETTCSAKICAKDGAFSKDMPEAEQVRWLATRSFEESATVESVLQWIFSTPTLSAHVWTTAFRTALRLSLPGFKSAATQALRQTDDPTAAAALEYLAAVSADDVFPLLGKYLKAPKARLRLAAIKILRSSDPLQAISSLFTLLQVPNADERALSMNCLVQFEFSLIRDRLVELLKSGKAPELFDSAFALFEANPEIDSLYPLFQLAKHCGGDIVKRSDLTRSRILELLVTAGRTTQQAVQALEAGFPSRLQLDEAKRAAPSPAYALRSLPVTEHLTGQIVLDVLKQLFVDHGRLILCALVLGLLLNQAFGCGIRPGKLKNPSGAVIQSGVTRAVGVLTDYENFGWTIKQRDGSLWRLSPPPGGFPPLSTGMKVSVEAAIYRRGSDGIFLGRCLSLSIVQ
ncbi:MAG: HEAT repeat domain-containing protein [Candidatus Ozemobacteraceae bacterium]